MNIVFVRRNWKSLSRGNFVMGNGNSQIIAPCALGRSGMTSRKIEGDGGTPIGCFGVLNVYYRPDRVARPITTLPVHEITSELGWSDGRNDRNYNRLVKLPYPTSHETLTRDDHLYDYMVVLDYNISTRKRGGGSAIFFHLAHSDYRPTEGCVAVEKSVMEMFLKRANTQTKFVIHQ
ncbi:MAG: L,D-transpeptidase family protein [Hyphomicrobiales bacterium]